MSSAFQRDNAGHYVNAHIDTYEQFRVTTHLDGGRELEYKEKTHTCTRKNTLHTERPWLDSNSELSNRLFSAFSVEGA